MFKRREFIKALGLTSAGFLGLGDSVLADVHGKPFQALPTVFSPIRIRGRVHIGGQGVFRAVVSDGRTVVQTNSSGEFELHTGTDRQFVFVSTPSGFEFKKQANASADFFQLIDKTKAEQHISFELTRAVQSDENHHFLLLD